MSKFLSVQILTKDSQDHIIKCMSSLIPLLPYILDITVIDDNSTDKTIRMFEAIKTKYHLPIQIFVEKKGKEGFAGQRNSAKNHTKAPWILILDSDETIHPNMFWEILALCQQKDILAWFFPRLLLFPDDKHYLVDGYPDYQMRLFRNMPEIKFIREVHEYLVFNKDGKEISLGINQPNTKITNKIHFYHYQLLTSQEKLKEKGKRWSELAQQSKQSGFEIIGEDAYLFKDYQHRIAKLPEGLTIPEMKKS